MSSRWGRKKPVTLVHQKQAMVDLFPWFTYACIPATEKKKESHVWRGALRISNGDEESVYKIRIEYVNFKPKVWIEEPCLREDAPHRWDDHSLCLYEPNDPQKLRWDSTRLLAQTIILWTGGWIRWYELWLKTGEWFGPEAPHRSPTQKV